MVSLECVNCLLAIFSQIHLIACMFEVSFGNHLVCRVVFGQKNAPLLRFLRDRVSGDQIDFSAIFTAPRRAENPLDDPADIRFFDGFCQVPLYADVSTRLAIADIATGCNDDHRYCIKGFYAADLSSQVKSVDIGQVEIA